MSKVISGHYYKVNDYKGFSGLVVHNTDSFDAVVEEVRDICKRAADRGYKNDDKFLIVLVEWENTYDDDGVFCFGWRKDNAVALYDNGNVVEY